MTLVELQTIQKVRKTSGNSTIRPRKGDDISIAYLGNLFDRGKPHLDYRGEQFDTTANRGDLYLRLGEGRVIKGLDDCILVVDGGMTLGEAATFWIPSKYAFGPHGFPGLIPPNSTIVLDIELKEIDGQRSS